MPRETDGDIKIFNAAAPQEGDDLDALAAMTEQLRAEGTLERAKRLARELAKLSVQSPELLEMAESFGFTPEKAREQQLHVLMVFSGQSALSALLKPQLLADAAITSMNNALILHAKDFWDTISDGGVFTQYRLALRNQDTPEKQAAEIGEVFARLCGQEDNPELCALGGAVFLSARRLIAAKWAQGEGG
ncbi:MAG: hypothetical protein LBQ33_06215 [Oscillospiraceae bacterium]|jgi:hypothetical protein|nr:hypothetical protein [Oscillospiraceae bacterium]